MAMQDNATGMATAAVNGNGVLRQAMIFGLQFAMAAWLYAFLEVDGIFWLLMLLAIPVVGFVVAQRRPALERKTYALFETSPRFSIAIAAILLLGLPFVLADNTYAIHLLIVGLLYSVLALALNFQLGSANLPNFATGASYGIGAYASALLAIHFGINFWLTLPIAAAVAAVFGLLIGIPCMRTRESYLALVTISFAVIVHQLLNNLSWTGGSNGLPGIPTPSLLGHSFNDPINVFGFVLPAQANFYYLSLLTVVLSIVIARRIHHSRVGLAWNALRADSLAASCQGINVMWYKVLAFVVDSFMAAVAGAIYAFYVSYIAPDNFTFFVSVMIMAMVIVGGMDNIFGVIVGAMLLTMLPEKFRAFADFQLLFFGAAVITMLILRPKGLFPKRLRAYPEGGQ